MTTTFLPRAFLALLLVVYATVFPYLQAINNPNENTRVYLAMAIVDHGSFRLDPVVQRFGWTNDMARVPRADGGSHYAAVKGPLMALAGAPIYAVQRAVLAPFGKRPPGPEAPAAEAAWWLRATTLTLQCFGVHLPCALFLLLLERRLRRWTADLTLRLSVVAAVGLGTNYLAYSFLFVSHAVSAVLAFVALDHIAITRLRARGTTARVPPTAALAAGLLAGLPTLAEYQNVALSVVLGLYGLSIFRSPRTLAAFAAGVALDVSVLAFYQHHAFGSALRTGFWMQETPEFLRTWQQGFFGLRLPQPEALRGLLFDRGYGLFGASPWMLLGLLGGLLSPWVARSPGAPAAPRLRRERRLQLGVAVAMATALALFVSCSVVWRGGWTVGPRYLGALPPLVALPAAALLATLARRLPIEAVRVASVGLAFASFAQLGALALLVTTLPESIERPLPQITLPLIELRLFPRHLFELLGASGPWPWYLTAAAALLALVAMALASRAPVAHRAGRLAAASLLAALLLWPAMTLPAGADHGPQTRGFFFGIWEPAGRDRLSRLRADDDPCQALERARLEQLINRPRDAALARLRAAACAR